mgnify:CR=1 FL=1
MTDAQAKWKGNAVSVLAVLMGLAFIASGAMKLAGVEEAVKRFQDFNYPLWFMYLTGAIEVGSGIAIMIRMLRFWGASLLICTMIGAIYSHAKIGEGAGEMIPPGLLLVLCAVVARAAAVAREAADRVRPEAEALARAVAVAVSAQRAC